MGELIPGIHCKACDRPIDGDPELCSECLNIARGLFRDLDKPDDEGFLTDEEIQELKKAAS